MDLLSGVISIASWMGQKAVQSAVAATARRLPEDNLTTAQIKTAISSELAKLGDQIASGQMAKLKGALTDYQNAINRIRARANADLQSDATEAETLVLLSVDVPGSRKITDENNQIMYDLQSAKKRTCDLIADEKNLAVEQRIIAVTTAMKCAILLEANLDDAWACCAGYLSLFYECNDVKCLLANERPFWARLLRQKPSQKLILDFSDSVLLSLVDAGVVTNKAVPDMIEQKVYRVIPHGQCYNWTCYYRDRVFGKYFGETCASMDRSFYSAINFISGNQVFIVLKGQHGETIKKFFGKAITFRDIHFSVAHQAFLFQCAVLGYLPNRIVFIGKSFSEELARLTLPSTSQFIGIPIRVAELQGLPTSHVGYPVYCAEHSDDLMCLIHNDVLWVSVRYWDNFRYRGNHLPKELKL